MKTVDVTFQNLDSSEISLTDVSHYFDSDPTKLVSSLRNDGRTPNAYIADTTTANAQARFFFVSSMADICSICFSSVTSKSDVCAGVLFDSRSIFQCLVEGCQTIRWLCICAPFRKAILF